MIQPDWDMFHSVHECAKFHAASRAICGGPVYLSDPVGSHDFGIIKKLAYPDGTVPRCIHFPLPTRDCLFKSPLFDQETLLKIWNLNKYGGVIGVFDCQGAGWDPKAYSIRGFPECFKLVSGSIHVSEVEWDQKTEAAYMGEAEEYAVYQSEAMKLSLVSAESERIPIVLMPFTFELFSFVPVHKLSVGVKFAPFGLTNMFNTGGTIQELEYVEDGAETVAKVRVGRQLPCIPSEIPNKCQLNGAHVPFLWLPDAKLTLDLPWIQHAGGISH